MRFEPPSEHELANALLSAKDDENVTNIAGRIRNSRSECKLLESVKAAIQGVQTFVLHPSLLALLNDHFGSLSPLSAYNLAEELIKLSERNKSFNIVVFLLRQLVFSVQVLNANKLRELVKFRFTDLFAKIKQLVATNSPACSNLVVCIFFSLLMELNYNVSADPVTISEEALLVWKQLMSKDSETSEQSPILALTDLLFQHELRLFGLYPETEIQILRIREVSERLLLNSSDFRQNEETKRDLINDNNFIVFDFLRSTLNTLAVILPSNELILLLRFMVREANRNGLFEELIEFDILQCPSIRFGSESNKVIDALHKACASENILLPKKFDSLLASHSPIPNTSSVERQLDSIDSVLEKNRFEFEQLLKSNDYEKCWKRLLSIFKRNPAYLQKCLENKSVEKINSLIDSLNQIGDLINGERKKQLKILHILSFILHSKRGVECKIHPQIMALFLAEDEPRIESLKLAARLIELNHRSRDFTLFNELISICFSFFVTAASSSEDEGIEHLLAHLNFIHTAITKAANIVAQQFALLTQIIPTFFHKVCQYRQDSRHSDAERLEHALSTVCNAIHSERKSFHKLVPFIIADSMTSERELTYPMHLLLSACDNYDLAFLSTNLSSRAKLRFSLLHSQFYKSNKIVG